MPLPIILGAAVAAGSALYGVLKGKGAQDNNEKADVLQAQAQNIYESARQKLEKQRAAANLGLEALGAARLQVWSEVLGDFVRTFKQFKNIRWEGGIAQDEQLFHDLEELKTMEEDYLEASEMVKAGLGSLASGALTGVAAYGGTMMLASASTGTAISALSGPAAAHATLAWLGGGTLAAGGLGITGGVVMLGGIVAGPVLAVAGSILAAKSEENLSRAHLILSEAKTAAVKLEAMTKALEQVEALAADYKDFIAAFAQRFQPLIVQMQFAYTLAYENSCQQLWNRTRLFFDRQADIKVDFKSLPEEQQKLLHFNWLMAQTLQHLLAQNLLDQEGKIVPAAQQLLEESHGLLQEAQNYDEAGSSAIEASVKAGVTDEA
jgi:hypothetical protein